jgi:hypothetical protein
MSRIGARRVTLGHIRSHGVRRLLIYCSAALYCHHSAVVDADRWPDETVLLDLDRRAVCTKCGMMGADVRPNWGERPPPGEPDRLTVALRRAHPAVEAPSLVLATAECSGRRYPSSRSTK